MKERHNIRSAKGQMDREIVFPKDDKTPVSRSPGLNGRDKDLKTKGASILDNKKKVLLMRRCVCLK